MIKVKKYCFLLGVLALLLVPVFANAEMMTVTGKVTGLTCLVQGFICPVDKADPMINLEKDFVVVTASGDYYFMSNIGLGLKGKYALETIEVSGDVNKKYKSIRVKTIKYKGKVVWSQDMESAMEKQFPFVVGPGGS
ncbi:MAG: hypothetical protein HY787_08910 [Deltaproteobacteria bacterium]|nr:hypothetical protein [Deltaproteobacteria bacterium]